MKFFRLVFCCCCCCRLRLFHPNEHIRQIACRQYFRLLCRFRCFDMVALALRHLSNTFLVRHENSTHTWFVYYWIIRNAYAHRQADISIIAFTAWPGSPFRFREWYCTAPKMCVCLSVRLRERERRPILLAFSCSDVVVRCCKLQVFGRFATHSHSHSFTHARRSHTRRIGC